MYAVISLSGHQYTVQKGDKLVVDSLGSDEGAKVEAEVLMTIDGDKIELGNPTLAGVVAELKVLDSRLGDKVRVYKMKAKKRYRRNKGHRSAQTIVEVVSIGKGSAKTAPAKEEATDAPKKAPAKKAPAKKAE